MNKAVFELRDNQFLFNEEVLLDCSDRLHNYSRIPMHRIFEDGNIILPELIIKNYNEQMQVDVDTSMSEYAGVFAIMDCIMSKIFAERGEPINVCEIGGDNGRLSMNISSLLAEFAPDNDYVGVCNSLGGSDNAWIKHISQVKNPAGLQLVVSDYSHTNLRDNYFYLTVINGTVPMFEPVNVIKEAVRITDEEGFILCFSDEQYLLDDSLRLLFSERKEYRINPEQVIYKVMKKDFWSMI